jgi:hypothetical protein
MYSFHDLWANAIRAFVTSDGSFKYLSEVTSPHLASCFISLIDVLRLKSNTGLALDKTVSIQITNQRIAGLEILP